MRKDLGYYETLICPPEPCAVFNINAPTLKEGGGLLKSARTASAPGPSRVPYKVFKQCLHQLEHLWMTSVQKGGVPGCIEYTSVVTQLKEQGRLGSTVVGPH